MLLRGINMTSRFLLQQYFSYPEIMENIDNSPFIYVDMLDKYFRRWRFEDGRLAKLLTNIPEYLKSNHIYGVDWVTEQGFVQLDRLSSTLDLLISCYHTLPPLPTLELNDALFKQSVIEAVCAATNNAKRRLSAAAVLELEMMILIHLQVCLPVGQEARDLVCKRVEALCFDSELPDIITGDEIALPDKSGDLSLPLYREGEGSLSIMRIVSQSDQPVALSLSGSALRRTVHPGQTAFAIKKCNAFVDFLPSFSVLGSVVYEAEAEGFKLSLEEKTKHVALGYTPSSWAASREFGTLVLDAQGRMDSRHALSGAICAGKAAAVAASGSHFCVLKEDGSVHSNFEKTNFADIISVSVWQQHAAAITSGRSAVLDNGSVLLPSDAARVLIFDNRQLVLTCDGSVYTGEGCGGRLPLPGPACAIALSADLYAAAVENAILVFSADGAQRHCIEIDGTADELYLREHTLYYRDPKTGLIEKCGV